MEARTENNKLTAVSAADISTGCAAADAVGAIDFAGNIIPPGWYKTIVKYGRGGAKPDLVAITILSEIVYWYRPSEVRDENTGEVVGFRKKFASDLLQCGYNQLCERFGFSVQQAKDGVRRLEELGVIRRELRTVTTARTTCSNVMHIELNVGRLKELTCGSGQNSMEVCVNLHGGVCKKTHSSHENSPIAVCRKRGTYTENTTKNTTKITTEISYIHPAAAAGVSAAREINETDEEEYFDEIALEIELNNGLIPKSFAGSRRALTAAVELLSDAERMPSDHFGGSESDRDTYRFAAKCLVEQLCADCSLIAFVNDCITADGDLETFLSEAADYYLEGAERIAERGGRVNAPARYMGEIIRSSFLTYHGRIEAKVAAFLSAPRPDDYSGGG